MKISVIVTRRVLDRERSENRISQVNGERAIEKQREGRRRGVDHRGGGGGGWKILRGEKVESPLMQTRWRRDGKN